jgi:outer membrane receptor protein involved in Fe transport
MMKYMITLILVCFTGLQGFAQYSATVSGRVADQGTGLPLAFASISISDEKSGALVTGAISDSTGRFVIDGLPKGSYIISFSYLGYATVRRAFLAGELNRVFDLGRIGMAVAAESIREVTVTAQKSVVDAGLDKKTFSIADNIAQSGGSVLDAMKTMPGVTVDQEGKVVLRGSDKVVVLIDGRQSSLTGFGNQKGLESIPASGIDRIEIINNPSAKYDAAGMAGIINIIYKTEKKAGFNGDAGFSYGLGTFFRAKPDLPTQLGSYKLNPKYIPAVNLNYKTPHLLFFLQSEMMVQDMLPNNEFTTRYYNDGTSTASQVPENRSQTHYIEKAGISWQINDRNALTLSGIYDWEIHIDTAQVPYIDLRTAKRNRYWGWREEEITGYMNYTAAFRHKFDEPGHELTVNGLYTKGWENENYMLRDSSAIRQGTDSTHILAIEHTTNLSADYVKPLSSGRLEAGSKLQWRRLPVEYTTTMGNKSIIYPGMGDWSKWGENTYAAYFNYVLEKPLYDVEAGIRAEETRVSYTIAPENIYYKANDSYRYFKLFPNVRLTWKVNPANSLSAFYNRRIDRPGEPELRIFPKYDDPELLKVGNPYLRPQLTQSLEAAYRHRWASGSVYFAAFHRWIRDPFMRIYSIDSVTAGYNIMNKIYQNTGQAINTGAELLVSQQVARWWKVSGTIDWYLNRIAAFEGVMLFPYERPFEVRASTSFNLDLKLISLFNLPKNFQIQASAVYYGPRAIPQGTQFARSSVDIGLKKVFLNGKADVSLSASDIFNNFAIRQSISGIGFTADYENYYETQVVRLALKYRF